MSNLEKVSHWAQILSFILAMWLVIRPSSWLGIQGAGMNSYVLPAILGFTLLVAGVLHLAAVILARKSKPDTPAPSLGIDPAIHKQTVDKFNECESMVRHWKGEVEREQRLRREQVEIRDQQNINAHQKIIDLQEALSVAQGELVNFTTPRARLKITRGRYWIEHPDTGDIHEEDVTEILDNMVLDEKLVLDRLYQLIFPEPLKHVRKKLTIDYSHGTRRFSVTVPESTKLTLPFPYDDIPFPVK